MRNLKSSIFLYLVLSGIAASLSYLTYPVLARVLPAGQYVNTTVALSLLTQMSTFLSSVVAIAIGLAKERRASDVENKVELLQSWLFRLFGLVIVFFLLISPWAMSTIHLPWEFSLPISALMLVSVPLAIVSGFLNGHKKMTKLGITAAMSAGLQFLLAVAMAIITHNGFYAMLAMAVSQIATISLIYLFFRKDGLPRVSQALGLESTTANKQFVAHLIFYTFLSSMAIMSINLVQISDLLIIKTLTSHEVKFYTDIYVISRIVFFGGLIFIWPFLSEIDINKHAQNYKPLGKLVTLFVVIALGAATALYLGGPWVTQLLFGSQYGQDEIRLIGSLSILYKLAFLLTTAVVLYFTVLRSYKAVWLAAFTAAGILLYARTTTSDMSVQSVLIHLNVLAGVAALASIVIFIRHRKLI